MHPETDPRYRLYLPSSSVAHNRKNPFPVFQSQQSYSLFLHSPNFLLPPENLCITVVFPDSQKLLPEFHPQPLCPTGILSYRYKDNLLFQELLMRSVSHRYWIDDMVSMHKPHYTTVPSVSSTALVYFFKYVSKLAAPHFRFISA